MTIDECIHNIIWHTEPWFDGYISTDMLKDRIKLEIEAYIKSRE